MAARASLGIGLIGAGRHGLRYARHILQDLPDAALVAVCRRHPEQRLDLPGAESVRMYGDARALIADPAVAVVIVVTPPLYAPEIAIQAIRAGKPVLVEKPLAVCHGDAKAIVDAAAAAKVPLMTAQTLRFDPVIRSLQTKRPLVGRLRELLLSSHIDTKARDANHVDGYGGRGALLEFGVHVLDLIRVVTGEEVREVRCKMDRIPPVAPDATASAVVTTTGGVVCRVDVARVPTERVGLAELLGSEGRLSADWIQRRLQFRPTTGTTEDWNVEPAPTVLLTLNAFLDAVAGGTPIPITGEDGCHAVEIAEACYRSAAGGGGVVSLPLRG